MNQDSKRRRKRRTCADWMRRDISRQRRGNPASKIILQILALFSAILAIAPPMQKSSFASGRDPRQPPSWYPNGPAAWARERGLESDYDPETGAEQPSPALRPKAHASWSRLVKDLHRGPTRERARELIEARVHPEALEWLREMIKLEDWMALRLVGHDRTKDEIRDFALLEAMKWQASRRPPIPPGAAATPDEPGDATPATGAGPQPK